MTNKLKRLWNHFWKNDLLEGYAERHYARWKMEKDFETERGNQDD